mmetsp:Transcript_11521/g.19488  ORF Transcript_11521/g.19488 Transcript_11521/m.19488 type:complete len:174 (+) Transcript_11521:664-1185(+)
MTFYEVLEATVEFKELVLQHINNAQIPQGNSIIQNYSQGILLEEGCSAEINSNHLLKNIKANIALGGKRSGEVPTRILYNQIEKSKQEGIFVVEGEQDLLIEANIITGNNDGIVLLHSAGTVNKNRIQQNERCGLYLLSDTIAFIEDNTVENNKHHGIDIRDPSAPRLKRNKV